MTHLTQLYTEQGAEVVKVAVPVLMPRPTLIEWNGRYFVWFDNYGQHREVTPYRVEVI